MENPVAIKETIKRAVLGLVESPAQAAAVALELQKAGFATGDISAIYPQGASPIHNGVETLETVAHSHAPAGALLGTGAGSLAGGALGWLAGVGLLAIPGVGPFLALGPILSIFSGIAAGAALGGFTGALIGLGISEKEAAHYDGQLKAGKVMLSVHVADYAERLRAKEILEAAGATNVVVVGSVSAAPAAGAFTPVATPALAN